MRKHHIAAASFNRWRLRRQPYVLRRWLHGGLLHPHGGLLHLVVLQHGV